ncbi:general transcription factor II-I repeat domain-containing protein 2B [Cebus imitator]|uniref:general transcription factor II-I repeat domain-containing protein 2B n=1 Tax=Cebus imitator TaxID=2715852 RepID=UPI00189A7431|nr:general transcription factor II-I repeat domain-containing protein 2B [Cebus imitator]
MAQVAVSTLPVEEEPSSESRMVVTFLVSALESMILTNAHHAFAGVAEGLREMKPPCPVNGMQVHSGETEILRKAVEDYFCLCYGKALGTTVMVPVPYEKMLQDQSAVAVQGLPEGVAFQHPENYDLATLKWILENKAGISFVINRPFLGPESQLGGHEMVTDAERSIVSPSESCGPISVKTEPMEDSGISLKAEAASVKKESEDPNYYQYNMQGGHPSSTSNEVIEMELPMEDSTPLVPSEEPNEDPEAEVKIEGNTNSSSVRNSAAGVEDLNIVQVTVPDNEKERLSSIEKIKQLREQVNNLFSRKFGEAIGVDFPVKVPYRKITFNPGCVVIDGMPPGVVFKAPGYLEISSMRRILDAAEFIKFTVIRGNEIFLRVEKSLKKFSIDWSKLVSVASTGTPAMVDPNNGLVTKLKSRVATFCKGAELKSICCIIHPESLCAQKLKMNHVMDVVVNSVNWICSRGLNHSEFTTLLYELDSQYGSLLYYTEIKWLSRGLVLKRFFESLEEIDSFMSSRGKPLPQLSSIDWIRDLAFLVDMTMHLNTLNISLQGHSQIVTQMYDLIRAFLAKLCLWETHLAMNNLAHFPTLKSVSRNESDGLNYIPKIAELKAEFLNRLSDFKLYESELTLFSSPFSTKIDSVHEELQMEVIDLQCNTVLKTKYDKVGIPEFYKYLWGSYPKYKHHCAKILSMFGSTYVCEQLFSIMKLSKTKYCSQLKDARWDSVLHIAT